jgi:hypothetical protein
MTENPQALGLGKMDAGAPRRAVSVHSRIDRMFDCLDAPDR